MGVLRLLSATWLMVIAVAKMDIADHGQQTVVQDGRCCHVQ